jgi:FkbM family methyltransferase
MTSADLCRNLLRRAGIYERVKASWIYEFYWTFADKHIVDDRREEMRFYEELLQGFREGDLIFDIGANIGYKSDIFLRLGANVVAVEPDENCQQILKEKFLKYRLKKRPFVLVGKAVSEDAALETMWIDAPGSAKNTLSKKWAETLREDETRFGNRLDFGQSRNVETVSLEQLITTHGLPFFIKIDVEGYELNVLRALKRAVPYLSFEVNLPEFRSEGSECVRVLGRVGQGTFNYTSDCRRSLMLKQWLDAEDFLPLLASCTDSSIEVFWKTPGRKR